jgi:hypothetical protein
MARRASGGSGRGNRSAVVGAVVAVVAVVAVAAGLGRLWSRPVLRLLLLLGPRSARRQLRMWRVEEGAGGRRGVFLRLPRPAPVAHSVTDAAVKGQQEGPS